MTFSFSYFRVQTAKEDDQITFGNDFADFDCELPDIDAIPSTNFLSTYNDIHGYNMKQIKSQQYSSAALATLIAKNFNNPSEVIESINAKSSKKRISVPIMTSTPGKENENIL